MGISILVILVIWTWHPRIPQKNLNWNRWLDKEKLKWGPVFFIYWLWWGCMGGVKGDWWDIFCAILGIFCAIFLHYVFSFFLGVQCTGRMDHRNKWRTYLTKQLTLKILLHHGCICPLMTFESASVIMCESVFVCECLCTRTIVRWSMELATFDSWDAFLKFWYSHFGTDMFAWFHLV